MAIGDAAPSWGGGGGQGAGAGQQPPPPGFLPPSHGGLFGHAPLPPNFQHVGPGGAAPSWGPPTATNPTPGQGYGAPAPGGAAPSWGPPSAANPTPGQGAFNPGQATTLNLNPQQSALANAIDPTTGLPVSQPRGPGGNAPGQPRTGPDPNAPYAGYGTGAPVGTPPGSDPLHPDPASIAGLGPANIQQFGGTPTVDPTYAQAAGQNFLTGNAALVNPNQNMAYMQQYEQLLGTSLAPQFQSQDQSLSDQLAARGLTTSGSGQYLQNQLYGQQAAALASGLQPIVSQGYGYTQQDIQGNQGAQNQFGLANLGYGNQALGTNAAYAQQANLANAGASNEANILNANYYNQDRTANYGAYNNFQNELLGLGSGQLSAEQAAYLNSFGPNSGVTSAYGNALTGANNAYSSVYGNALAQQTAELNAAAAAAAGG